MDYKKNELIGINLNRLRNKQKPKLSIRRLAEEVGLSNGYLSKLETGKIKGPSLEAMMKLSDFFNVDLSFFITDPRYIDDKGKDVETNQVYVNGLTLDTIKNINIIDDDGNPLTDDERNFMLDALKNYRASKVKFITSNISSNDD
ncbi:helix-turn-helix transcriptional regulator [Bacillus altitudinis]|uniref:helix-turn-helix domain-containing protein n=1 Tax=Bacillus altitudinis TaxID=293387 RepID=UPI0022AF7EB9|nr:helix-turn-helix transcriptional regulator [Bacillus altitudinis]MDR7669078.1 helix-turn-helix transcriptional regulator [Bacillus altitudinis]